VTLYREKWFLNQSLTGLIVTVIPNTIKIRLRVLMLT